MGRPRSGPRLLQTIYLPIEDATPLIAIGNRLDKNTRDVVVDAFRDQMILLGLESGAVDAGGISEPNKTEYKRQLAKLLNRCQDQINRLN